MKIQFRFWWLPWFGFVLALTLRLWNLGIPPEIVSDEISFVNHGRSYVTHQSYFDPHPPLGKMVIGAPIKFFGDQAFIWRLSGAIGGALIIPILWWITWRLTRRRAAAMIAMVLALLDGLMLVDSRLGLINIPYLITSLGAFACLLKALGDLRPIRWLLASGTLLGAALATKWLAVLVGLPLVTIWLWPKFFGLERHPGQLKTPWWATAILLGAWPLLVYWVFFVVHFAWLGVPQTFWSTNIQMLNYHLSVPPIGDPNQQPWWAWLLAWRPFPYWTSSGSEQVSIIRSLPNPWIWWSGAVLFIYSLIRGWRNGVSRLLNILLLCAWIPFAFIQRIMYSYHALLFDVWLIILIATYLGRAWGQYLRLVVSYLVISLAVFVWFAPWYLNIPLTPQQHRLRQWLPTWSIE